MLAFTRRFTPPSCTLEIKSKQFLLFRQTSHNLLKNCQFELRFDDPQVSTSKQTIVRGDRQDLEQLQLAVNDYLEKYLHPSFQPENKQLPNTQPYLQSEGLVDCVLFLGSLDGDHNGNKIKLTTVQLFDLVTALEAYRDWVATLPKSKQPQIWGVVAATAIAAVGIVSIFWRTESVPDVASVSEPEPQTPIPEPDELDEVVPPQITTARQPTPQPKLTEPLTSATKLPPPPAVDAPKPQPNIPDPADLPLSEVASLTGIDIPKAASQEQTESTIAIAPDTVENDPKDDGITSESATITDSSQSGVESPTIQIDPDVNSTIEIPARPRNESPENIVETEQIEPIAKALQPSQLEQVIAYYQEKWQPPVELKQSLEYRLWLSADGTIERVVPLGKAARLYLSQTNIPVTKRSFIDPVESQPSTIRLLLDPDGRVQAFEE